jgi:hypothetical protein
MHRFRRVLVGLDLDPAFEAVSRGACLCDAGPALEMIRVVLRDEADRVWLSERLRGWIACSSP